MGKIIFFDDERKTSNNKNLRMKQMTAVDMVRASQATLSKATVWKTRRIHLAFSVFLALFLSEEKVKVGGGLFFSWEPRRPVGKVDSWKVKVELSSLENWPRRASRRSVGKPLEEDAISPPGWDLSRIDFSIESQCNSNDVFDFEIQVLLY